MLQAGTGDPVYPLFPWSVRNFDEPADQQPFKYLVDHALGHPRRKPYLCGTGCIILRDRRQHPFLIARQQKRFVIRARHHPKGSLRVGEANLSLCMQPDQKLANALMGYPQFLDDLAPRFRPIQQIEQTLSGGAR
jgi:hypothetical protein